MQATFSMQDDKIRIYPVAKLPQDEYERVKAAGFQWAPKQGCFYAVWSPGREDLAEELAGGIDDETTTAEERAEARAERFDGYGDKRQAEADRARKAVDAIADQIPFGQPILVGHHSQRRAERDAEKIKAGMSKAVKLWRTSQYWQQRASSVIAHAEYKELPAVRYRRIKKLESEKRKHERGRDDAAKLLRFWSRDGITQEQAIAFTNIDDRYGLVLPDGSRDWSAWSALDRGTVTVEYVATIRRERMPDIIAHEQRWIDHYENRIAYERAMLQEQGGITAERYNLEIGGKVLAEGKWLTITKLTKKGGEVVSVSTNNTSYPRVVPVERIKGYEAPAEGVAETVKAATKLAPICNYPGTVAIRWYRSDAPKAMEIVGVTKTEWDKTYKDCKGTRDVEATETTGRHRVRAMIIKGRLTPVYLTDEKVKMPPSPTGDKPAPIPTPTPDLATLERRAVAAEKRREKEADRKENPFEQMADSLRAGVQVVSAPNLFPTPEPVARRVVQLAEIEPGMAVMEPSAGTGNLAVAVRDAVDTEVLAYEINPNLCEVIRNRLPNYACVARCADFLTVTDGMGQFDRVVMNPPFDHGTDIAHVRHAMKFVRPGGKVVAIVANGPKQQSELMPLADLWEELPSDTFAGTSVRSAIAVFTVD